MANMTDQEPEAGEQQPPEDGKPTHRRLRKLADWLLSRRGLAVLLAASLTGHAIGYVYHALSTRASRHAANEELPLGEFHFTATSPEPGQVRDAAFSLHLALLDEIAPSARQQLQARKFRVEQGVEELLRRAHGTDFDDPALAELKRQLQEQVNRSLGLRAVADVIITDLAMERTAEEPVSIRQTAEMPPWTTAPAEEAQPAGLQTAESPDSIAPAPGQVEHLPDRLTTWPGWDES